MRIKHPFLSSLAIAAALAAPAGISTSTSLQAQTIGVKIYDRDHKDYHVWDDREDRAYRAYCVEVHREYRPYTKLKRADQSAYWTWRHAHPDR
jgi:hypothetical protein